MAEDKNTKILQVADREVPLVVSRHPRARHMSLRLDGVSGQVRLVLPRRTSLSQGLDFAERKADWLLDQLDALPARVPFVPGSRIPILGVEHVIAHEPEARRGVWRADGAIRVSGQPEHIARRVRDFLRAEARKEILPRARAKAAAIERPILSLTLRDMSSRWGSCNSDGRLCFSWRLILAPEAVLDYVVAHEVAHLAIMNHGRRFWRLTAKLTADVEGARDWLRDNGDGLLCYG